MIFMSSIMIQESESYALIPNIFASKCLHKLNFIGAFHSISALLELVTYFHSECSYCIKNLIFPA